MKKNSLVLLLLFFMIGSSYVVFSKNPILASEEQETFTATSEKVQDIEAPVASSGVLNNENAETTEKEIVKNDITFVLPEGQQFVNGTNSETITVDSGQSLPIEAIPKVAVDSQTQVFKGWSVNGKTVTNDELVTMSVSEPLLLVAMFETKTLSRGAKSIDTSIQSIIAGANQANLIVVPDPSGGGAAYKEYPSTDAGLKTALADLYTNGNGADFAMYIGTNFMAATATTAKVVPATVNATNATFYALQGKIRSLVLTGHPTDPINNNTTAVSGQRTLTIQGAFYAGSNLSIRNLNYNGANLFMNGNSLSLNGGSYGDGWNVYGGSDSTNVTGSPTITVNATGSGTWAFYGGSSAGGTLTGNTNVIINKTVGAVTTLSGGAYIGTVAGNTSLTVNDVSGIVTNIYGAGQGTNATNKANVTGNVATTVNVLNASTSFRVNNFYGSTIYGDVTGTVTNTVSGYGGWTGTNNNYFGGSANGNIGSDRSAKAITNNLDTSQFTTGRADFIGANQYQGTITGSIANTVKAGSFNSGSFNSINGGAGFNVNTANITTGTDAAYDAMTPEARRAYAESVAQFKVYGNIFTKLVEGNVSYNGDETSYSRGAGFGGYIEGNTTIDVGTLNTDRTVGGAGFVYSYYGSSYVNGAPYLNNNNTRANGVGTFDIVGGGGTNGSRYTYIYIFGNTATILNNVVARWTYGGSFSGVIEGNTSNTLNAGIVDTLEGAGYAGKRVYGDTKAVVNNGEVDWFLSGGGWNDQQISGNVSVEVNDGTINASMGASYGAANDHTIKGNSNNVIKGGDFSGTPRTGPSAFSGGVTNLGTLLGNASLTIDLRNYTKQFKLPSGTSISGGVPYTENTTLGTDANNTITLNIYTKPGSNALNGANIYGDGGSYANNTRSGAITMNIDAPDSNIGNLYATNYSNISSNKILRDVTANVQRVAAINGISGGSATDNFTTAIATASTNKAAFTFGAPITSSDNQVDPINVAGTGVVNFTDLTVKNKTTVRANGGNILNGRSATAANHGATYNGFGNITLKENSSLGVSTGTNFISGGALTVQGESKLISGPGTGIINISDFIIPDSTTDRLTWVKTTSNDAGSMTSSTGTWFGANSAYQVLTVNPTVANATRITPIVFRGIEQSTGKTFIGDNDTTKGANGYGIAIPGSIIDYQVINPVVGGKGDIKHNVSQVKVNNQPLTLAVWGSEVAGMPVQKGRLVVPSSSGVLPTLTFTPETTNTGSWLYNANIATTKIGDAGSTIAQQTNSNPVNWKSPSGEYSYTVNVQYSNQVELNARNVIVKESEAALVKSAANVDSYTGVTGRPFLTNDITASTLATIQKPLDPGQTSRVVPIHYSAGTTADNTLNSTVNVVIVKDAATVSTNRYVAVYAEDSVLKLEEANGLANQQALETNYTKAVAILADGTTAEPSSDAATFTSIKNTTSDQLPKSVGIDYSYSSNGDTAKKSITVQVVGILEIVEAPATMDFGEQKTSNKEQVFWPTINGSLTVSDTRGSGRQPWTMQVKETTPLTSGTYTLANLLSYVDGGVEQTVSSSAIVIESYAPTADGSITLTDGWGKAQNKGIKLVVPVKNQRIGSYSGTLDWTLVDAPSNE